MTRICLFAIAVVACATSLLAQSSAKPSTGSSRPATYAPAPNVPADARAKHLSGAGMWVLHVRADGTVSRVETLKSTGHPVLDKASVDAFSKWRFIPGAIKSGKVKIPVTYTGNYTKPPKT